MQFLVSIISPTGFDAEALERVRAAIGVAIEYRVLVGGLSGAKVVVEVAGLPGGDSRSGYGTDAKGTRVHLATHHTNCNGVAD